MCSLTEPTGFEERFKDNFFVLCFKINQMKMRIFRACDCLSSVNVWQAVAKKLQ